MSERPKTDIELANEMLLKSNPSELLKEKGRESPTIDDYITSEIDVTRREER
jgi:hypothetical protein